MHCIHICSCYYEWSRNARTKKLDVTLNETMRILTGCLRPTPVKHLPPMPVLSGKSPPPLHREHHTHVLIKRPPKTPHLLHSRIKAANVFAFVIPVVDMQQLLDIPISTSWNNGKSTGKKQINQLNSTSIQA